jgi:hypothetical protein
MKNAEIHGKPKFTLCAYTFVGVAGERGTFVPECPGCPACGFHVRETMKEA